MRDELRRGELVQGRSAMLSATLCSPSRLRLATCCRILPSLWRPDSFVRFIIIGLLASLAVLAAVLLASGSQASARRAR